MRAGKPACTPPVTLPHVKVRTLQLRVKSGAYVFSLVGSRDFFTRFCLAWYATSRSPSDLKWRGLRGSPRGGLGAAVRDPISSCFSVDDWATLPLRPLQANFAAEKVFVIPANNPSRTLWVGYGDWISHSYRTHRRVLSQDPGHGKKL